VDRHSPISYSHVRYDIDIEQHALAMQLPTASNNLQLQYGLQHFHEFCFTPGSAAKLDDFIRTGQPLVGLRITSFANATLLAVSWPHGVMDSNGFKSMLTAWCLVLAGRDDQVADVKCPFNDAMHPLLQPQPQETHSTTPPERYLWADKMLTGWRFVWFVVRYVWTLLRQPKVTSRTMVLPAAYMAELRREASLTRSADVPFVSDGDLICAWFTRLVTSTHGWRGSRPITQLNVVDMRSRLPSVFDPTAVYLQNLTAIALSFLDAATVSTRGLGDVAAHLRTSITHQTTEPQLKALQSYGQVLRHGAPGLT
jgi:hypothetical protein